MNNLFECHLCTVVSNSNIIYFEIQTEKEKGKIRKKEEEENTRVGARAGIENKRKMREKVQSLQHIIIIPFSFLKNKRWG